MLKKFVSIKNVGVFRNSPASGDTEFRKLTLIHAHNGRGKTTLCAIMRSLKTGDSTLVMERRTLDGAGDPHVHMLIGGGTAEFKNGSWGSACDHLEVFDADFIAANVYSGDAITHEHKKSICRFVLGADGVKLAVAYDSADGAERAAATALSTAKFDLQKIIARGMVIDTFIGLVEDPEVDKRIADKKAEIAVIKDSTTIETKASLAKLLIEDLPPNLDTLLGKTIDGVAADAEERIRTHLEKHKMKSEAWLSEGLGYVVEEDCPFCGQSLAGSPVIGSIRSFFSDAYRAFQTELSTLQSFVMGISNDATLLKVQKVIKDNAALVEFWRKYTDKAEPTLSFDDRVQPAAVKLRVVNDLLTTKISAPLEAVKNTATNEMADWKKLREEVTAYNAAVDAFNLAITGVKKSSESKSTAALEQELATLEARKARHGKEGAAVVKSYQEAVANKSAAEKAKEKAKDDLDAYNDKVMGMYQSTVNDMLTRFGAAFRLSRVEIEYTGRAPRVGYAFGLRGVDVEPGGDNTPAGTPCFRNTLSSGDRSTLALALFMAQIKNRKDLASLIVVFDDPFTSLDDFRQQWTCYALRRLAEDAKQVIVLSHSLEFLKLIANRCDKPNTRTLKLDHINAGDSRIIEFNLDDAAAALVDKDVLKLRSYHYGDEKDAPATVRCIRPILENHMRKLAPDDCPEGNGWLGTFLGTIKSASAGSALAVFQPDYDDYDFLNAYTSPYAHDSGTSPAIDEEEARSAVGLTLKLIGRI
ncbi:MAG: AAA family ATPase [Pirellulales bacterium]